MVTGDEVDATEMSVLDTKMSCDPPCKPIVPASQPKSRSSAVSSSLGRIDATSRVNNSTVCPPSVSTHSQSMSTSPSQSSSADQVDEAMSSTVSDLSVSTNPPFQGRSASSSSEASDEWTTIPVMAMSMKPIIEDEVTTQHSL
jgi:hypothetical protein